MRTVLLEEDLSRRSSQQSLRRSSTESRFSEREQRQDSKRGNGEVGTEASQSTIDGQVVGADLVQKFPGEKPKQSGDQHPRGRSVTVMVRSWSRPLDSLKCHARKLSPEV
eukprot:Skav223140  [mRNA]  locus=scaffold470:208535:209054:- [translate_table: standard]